METNNQPGSRLTEGWKFFGLVLFSLAAAVHCQTIDSFNPSPFGSAEFTTVNSMIVQENGEVVMAGWFRWLGGQMRTNIGRVHADGGLDATFFPIANTFNDPYDSSWVDALVRQSDGKIIVGGSFNRLCGVARTNIGRLSPDGTLDASFTSGADGGVSCLAQQNDGKILVGGWFTNLCGQIRNCIGRLNPDGSLDTSFDPNATGGVYALAVQPDGKILVAGTFVTLGGQACTNVGRLNPDGTLDLNLDPLVKPYYVYCFAPQRDGKILVAGWPGRYITRLNADGTLDTHLDTGTNNLGSVYSVVIQADGKILIGGDFEGLGGRTCTNIGRLNADGTLEPTFNVQFGSGGLSKGYVHSLALQPDGKILLGGHFFSVGRQLRCHAARLINTVSATQSLTLENSVITWLRAGSSPEVSRTTFEVATNGQDWFGLHGATRTTTGWQVQAPGLPLNATVRARGFLTGGYHNGSSWFVETSIGLPFITLHPASRTNNAETVSSFKAAAVGTSPLTYRWEKDGVALGDVGHVSGAQTSILTLSNVLRADEGAYSVVISNVHGSVTSLVANLAVNDPYISRHPVSRRQNAGSDATFSLMAAGTAVLGYQWRKNGLDLHDDTTVSGAQTPVLTLHDVLGGDAGIYFAVVDNIFGCVTTSVASLSVVDPVINTHPISQWAHAGETATFSVAASGTALTYRWSKDGASLADATAESLTLTNVHVSDAGTYRVQVSSTFGSATSAVALLHVNLAIPGSFDPGVDGLISSLAIQPNGQILFGGSFTNLGGQERHGIGRLNANGSLDTSFDPRANGTVYTIALQPDGRILLGGSFTNCGGQARNRLARLHEDGTLDSSFDPGANGEVYSLTMQADGRIIAAGAFTSLGGQLRSRIARMNGDGSVDSSFHPQANNSVKSLAVQPDGKILVGGLFTLLDDELRSYVGRLNPDGTLDTVFNPGPNDPVYTLVLQADSKILIGGEFTMLSGFVCDRIGRLNPEGAPDYTFNPGANGAVYALALQTDGQIILGGSFTILRNQERSYIARLNNNGMLDNTFNPGANSHVYSLGVEPNGDVIVGGVFTTLGGQLRNRIGRLDRTAPATQILTYDGLNISWVRGGTSPEAWLASFEASTNDTDWLSLGTANRVTGGWQLTGISLPTNATIRARGLVTGGQCNGSTWFVETSLTLDPNIPPMILLHDGNFGFLSNHFGFNITGLAGQVVIAEGSTNLLDWVPLATNILGSGPLHFSDPESDILRYRFHRARLK